MQTHTATDDATTEEGIQQAPGQTGQAENKTNYESSVASKINLSTLGK